MNIMIPQKDTEMIYNNNKNQTLNLDDYLYPNVKVGIIMPAYNEELNIGNTLTKIPKNISNKLDIIVIDDGSLDKTYQVAKMYNPIIIRHVHNKGNGAAIQTGLEYCKKNNYDIIIILDADGQHDPSYLKDFIHPIINQNYDLVIGNRFKFHYDMSIVKKLCSSLMSIVYSILLRKKISDPTMGYRSLSANVIKNLSFQSSYSITQEMLFKIIPYYSYCEIPIKINQREYGQSFIRLKKYFYKTLFSFIKFYLYPRIRRYSDRVITHNMKKKVVKLLKT